MLSRLPNSTLADLQKGDAVMIVSTEGGDSNAVTAITLLAGVEAILTAAPIKAHPRCFRRGRSERPAGKVKPRSSEQSQSMFSINVICLERIRCVLKYLSVVILANLILAILIPATLIGLAAPASAQAQAQSSIQSPATTGTLRGQVTDPSGAVVTNATVAVLVSGGQTHSATTNRSGAYEIGNLAPGKYTVTANAQGFAVFVQNDVDVAAGQVAQFNIALDISVQKEKVNVQEETPQVDVNPASNASAIVLSGKDLEALPDDPDELQSDLEALAGPSAGPNGGQIYIDGFTGGQLPPKSSIREIRINQNPFSAEYDKLGYGRIEIFTKPGTDKYHGQFSVEGNNSGLNSRNPFLDADATQPYDSVIYMGNIGGPINKKASFFFNVQRRNIDEIAVVNAPALDLSESVPNPRTRTNISPRLDYQVTPSNTLTARYQYYRDTQENAGVGGFVLPEAGYDTTSTEHTLQITDTQVLGTKAINETRFQYLRDSSGQTPLSTAVGINVLGEFTRGGASSGTADRSPGSLRTAELHFDIAGQALPEIRRASARSSRSQYVQRRIQWHLSSSQTSRLTTALTPSQLSIDATTSGAVPTVPVTVVDAGLYVQDDWKVRPTFTVSGGLRFETQNAIHDHADWAPRLGFAWGIGGGGKSAPKTVLRGGFGLFYDRFTQDLVLNADRLNGVTQQQYIVPDPTLSEIPPVVPRRPPTTQTIYQISPNLHAPYIMQSAFSLERQVTKIANVTVTYLNSRGVHQFLSLNVNAPLPGTPCSAGPQSIPEPGPDLSVLVGRSFPPESTDREFQHPSGREVVACSATTALNYANSDASGASSFPIESVRFECGLRASFVCDPGSAVCGRHNRTAAWVSPESIYDFQFGRALQRLPQART